VASKGITSGLSAEPNAQTGPLAGAIQSTRINDTEARTLHGRDLVLARGAYIPCVLETQLVSNIAGFVSCIVTENIYSDNGHTVLIERGAHVSGEYRSDTRNGDTRLFVLWDRIKTPYGILVDVESPGGDAVGGQGLPGYIDNHWWERIGAAFLLSSFQDVVGIAMAREAAQSSGTTINTAPTNTVGTAQDLAKEVLSSTINIPPTLFKNRGELLTIYVARDLRFDGVYRVQ
jgi:type IV secretion system protein VirB10